MTFAISRAEIAAVFGAEGLATVPPERINPAVTHAPTARFLEEVGLPDVPEFVFWDDGELGSGLTSALDRIAHLGDFTEAPLDGWGVPGYTCTDTSLLDGATGKVWIFLDGDAGVAFVNSGIDLFARFLAALHRNAELLHPDHDMPEDIEAVAKEPNGELRALDPAAFADDRCLWPVMPERLAWDWSPPTPDPSDRPR
ncbi:SUKH-4 family immunity protein [Streptomyces sp. CT34]|uniref:SUKH-4 family immunity protein n=1 Tax=Streptomyces sp. CT34 TaxID=1553907 RepID=UPI0005BB7CFD|nr:SUKH-4 family immunity protein [Streptomyces sp. CT34]